MRPDEELVEAWRGGGDRKALAELLGRYVEPVYRTAFRILRREADAEDVAQKTFLTVIQKMRSLKDAASFRPWMYRICVNHALEARRSRREADPVDDR
ncbi:MAG: RNA polymerase sigma factor, partial [Planctomycetota bacterium]